MMNDLIEADVVCHTDFCMNSEITIRVLVDSVDLYVICGPCGNTITDIQTLNLETTQE